LRMGTDLGFDSIDAVAAEIAAVVPSHRGLTPALLARRENRDGIVVPVGSHEAPGGDARPGETIAVSASLAQGETIQDLPEPESSEAPLEPGSQAPGARDPGAQRAGDPQPAPPPLMGFAGVAAGPPVRPLDAYSMRLVTSRSLYDAGVLVQRSPALAPLAPGPHVSANPHDLSRLGVKPGDLVRITSARAALVLPARADAGVPRGSVVVDFNQPGEGAADLVDAGQPVTDVRVETVSRVGTAPGRQGRP